MRRAIVVFGVAFVVGTVLALTGCGKKPAASSDGGGTATVKKGGAGGGAPTTAKAPDNAKMPPRTK